MGKQEMRKRLTDLSFTEKVKILGRLRDRSLALAVSGVEMSIDYPGDDGGRTVAWFRERLRSIGTCLSTGHPEATLALVYSGIDVFGWLAAPQGIEFGTGDTYKNWCNKYLVNQIQSVEGLVITGDDLWAARCGMLHTSTPISRLSRHGQAYELWYQYQGKTGVNYFSNTGLCPLGLDIEKLALAFREAGIAFIQDLKTDQEANNVSEQRAQNFLRWGGVVHIGKPTI
jgi:hypothetical protein